MADDNARADDDEEVSYGIRITRRNSNGSTAVIEWDGYGVFQELLDAILETARQQGWQVD